MTGNDILNHLGKISHNVAIKKANEEYTKYKERTKNELSKVERDFIEQIDTVAKSFEK